MFEVPAYDGCPFCDYLSGTSPCAFVTRGGNTSSFLNRTQYERGAVLLVPDQHFETILDLDHNVMHDLYIETQRLAHALIGAFGAVGLNVFQNNGVRADQTVPHYHIHLVPRYSDSDPDATFREKTQVHTPLAVLKRRAAKIRSALSETAA